MLKIITLALVSVTLFGCSHQINNSTLPKVPFTVSEGLFDHNQADTLGLTKPQTMGHALVFKGGDDSGYNHGAVLFAFNNKLYIQWQSSARDEDAPETTILMSVSDDGKTWSAPSVLVAARENAIVTNGGWWSDGKTLIAYINIWPSNLSPKEGYVEYIESRDGVTWSDPKPLLGADGLAVKGVIEQDLKTLPNGRILTALHQQPGLVAKPFYTDDPRGVNGWQVGAFNNLPFTGSISRELEPSWFLNGDDNPVMVFRDQGNSHRVIAAQSHDNGKNWSSPAITQMPDSRAKQSAGNLPDGRVYLLNNPSGTKTRAPLVVTVSEDGKVFDRAFLVKGESELPPMRYSGKYKRVGYSYPKSYVWNNKLWLSYAVNKEDIEVTWIDFSHTP